MNIDGLKVPHKIRVPGKIMFSGEYSVLYGYPAISSSLNTYMDINIVRNNDKVLRIYSSFYKKGLILKDREDILKIDSLALKNSLLFCLDHSEINIFNYDLKEISSWSIESGFGSSSAIILSILYIFLSYKYKKEEILSYAYNIQRQYQGKGSGYDFVTQSIGGVIEYRKIDVDNENNEKNELNRFYKIKPVHVNIDINRYIHIFTSNIGSKTSDIMKRTLSFLNKKETLSSFLDISNQLSCTFLSFLGSNKEMNSKLLELYDLVDVQQNFFYDLDFYPDIIRMLRKNPLYKKEFTVKTTGAGGSDAILLIGDRNKLDFCFNLLKQKGWYNMLDPFSKEGLYYES